jgi:hypothetical protein
VLKTLLRFILILVLGILSSDAHPNHQLDLTYATPGSDWQNDGLPLGNGYFGALVLGGVAEDRIRITDPLLRDATHQLQPLADLVISTGHDPVQARTFLRRLDLQTASVEVSYRDGRVRHRREYFASHPDRVLVGRLRAVKKKSLNLTLSWDSPHQQAKIRYDKESNRFVIAGELAGRPFETQVELRLKDGEIIPEGNQVRIKGASQVAMLLTVSQGETFSANARLDSLKNDDAIAIYQKHLPEYQEWFHAMYLTLEGGAKSQLDTSKRRLLYAEKPEEDPGFEELLFQYGRYLLLASSRKESPSPVQARGIWWFPPSDGMLNNRPIEPNLVSLIQSGAGPSQLPTNARAFDPVELQPWINEKDTTLGRVVRLIQSEGDEAYQHLRQLLQTNLSDNLLIPGQNLAVNMALVRGMTDLFAKEAHDGALQWISTLPSAWPDGSVVGLRTRNVEIAYVWQSGAFLEGYLTRLEAGEVTIQTANPLLLSRPGQEEAIRFTPDKDSRVHFTAEAKQTLRLQCAED